MKLRTNNNNISQADPFIIQKDNYFYIFTTGVEGVKCYKSNDLLGPYNYLGIVFNRSAFKEYWAPEVIKVDNIYYMYVSCMPDYESDVHTQRLMVASSNNIEGPYEFINELVAPFSIDANPVMNETGMYLFYSINEYEGDKIGTRIVVDRLLTPTKLEGNPKVIVKPTLEEEIFMKDRFKEGQDWYTIEGACYFYENDTHYLLYSANCYQNKYYFVGYSMSNSTELDLTKVDFKKYPDNKTYKPLLARNEFESGTGHNSLIKINNDWYIVYHGRDISEENMDYDNRNMRIAKLTFKDNELFVDRKAENI